MSSHLGVSVMPRPYSYDLRRKVIEAIELNGMKRCEASEYFNISRNTINLWLQRKAQTGDFRPSSREYRSSTHKIVDWEKFRVFAQTYGDRTQEEMAQLWEEDISSRTISRALKKIGFTRKKKPTVTLKEMKNYASSFSKN